MQYLKPFFLFLINIKLINYKAKIFEQLWIGIGFSTGRQMAKLDFILYYLYYFKPTMLFKPKHFEQRWIGI
jgi:hypothetical protein